MVSANRSEIAKKVFPTENYSSSEKNDILIVMYYNHSFISLANWNFKMRWDNDELMFVQISNQRLKN